MLTVTVYPDDVAAMLSVLNHYVYVGNQPLVKQPINGLILLTYFRTWSLPRIYMWNKIRHDREYTLRMPKLVALALFDEMTSSHITPQQQGFLDKLSYAILNHKDLYTIHL